jgi:hypothetical protein
MSEEISSKKLFAGNWAMIAWLIGLCFACGVIYSEFQTVKSDIRVIDERVDKKIEIQNDIKASVQRLMLDHAYQQGFEDANAGKESKKHNHD